MAGEVLGTGLKVWAEATEPLQGDSPVAGSLAQGTDQPTASVRARLVRIQCVRVRAVVRSFLRDRDIMRVVLPHRRSTDEDKPRVVAKLVDRLGS